MTPATIPTLTLNNGVTMPALGLGVYQSPPEQTTAAVETALHDGYRLIDTAAAYGNEREVGEAVRRSGVDRDAVFVTTKLWISDYGYERALVRLRRSLRRLGLDYVDLYLLHQPMPTDFEATVGRLQGRREGARRRPHASIGICNHSPQHLAELIDRTDVVPAVNQVELHPYFTQQSAARRRRRAWHHHPVVVADRRRVRLRPGRPEHGEEPARRPDDHRPRRQVRQDPGPGRPALAHRARRSAPSRSPSGRTASPRTSTSSTSRSTPTRSPRSMPSTPACAAAPTPRSSTPICTPSPSTTPRDHADHAQQHRDPEGPRGQVHRRRLRRRRRRTGGHVDVLRRQRPLHAGRSHRMAHPPARTDDLRHGRRRTVPARRWPDRRDPPGDRVFFEPGEKHWHGAAPDRFMVHLAHAASGRRPGAPSPGASTSATAVRRASAT